MMSLRDRIAYYLAVIMGADYFYDDIEEWESMDEGEQEAYPDEYPGMAYDDRDQFLDYADKLILSLGLEKWNDGPANSMERYMTRWFDTDGL